MSKYKALRWVKVNKWPSKRTGEFIGKTNYKRNILVTVLKNGTIDWRNREYHDEKVEFILNDGVDVPDTNVGDIPQSVGSQPADREGGNYTYFLCPSCGKSWDTKKHNACECGALLVLPNTDKPVKESPDEVPEEIMQWIGEEWNRTKWEEKHDNYVQFEHAATAMYHKLQERPEGIETPDETTQRKLAEWYFKQLRECQASLSSIKEERDQFKDFFKLSERDRDLFKIESENHQARWKEATEALAEKNIESAEYKDELSEIISILNTGLSIRATSKWGERLEKLLNKYTKKEEENG